MNRVLKHSLAFSAWLLIGASFAQSSAVACGSADFSAVVDETAQALRQLNGAGAERMQAKLRNYQKKHRLTDQETQARAAALQDSKMGEFNREIEVLVGQMDTLSQTPGDKIDCQKLDELKRVRDRLLTVMGQKSGYMLAKADIELDRPAGATPKTAAPKAGDDAPDTARDPKETAQPTPAQAKKDNPKTAAVKPLATPDLPERRPPAPIASAGRWQTDSQPLGARREEPRARVAANDPSPTQLTPPPGGDQYPLPSLAQPPETHYSIAEISEAGRGLFGTVSAQFGAAINYTFQRFGKPDAYIAGSEGSAAFLAGLRYGKGQLNTKTQPPRVIYWQGPSVGYDLGAEGSETLFLVYNLTEQDRIFGRFSGIGGSAYVAGGVGLNVLGKGNMVMVPIKAGIGLRLGANLAYLKFTERQTWNPF